jgi:hypothetical protein
VFCSLVLGCVVLGYAVIGWLVLSCIILGCVMQLDCAGLGWGGLRRAGCVVLYCTWLAEIGVTARCCEGSLGYVALGCVVLSFVSVGLCLLG